MAEPVNIPIEYQHSATPPTISKMNEDSKDRLQAVFGDVLARGIRTSIDGILAAHFGPLIPTPIVPAQGTVILVMLGKHLREQAAALVTQNPGNKFYSIAQCIVSFLPI